ncbi:MAG: SMC-Scp complex subunit ScpB [Candidatus Pelethousia sp.]|nr:SMC-Scp complex subunit ScpB [Candidatus Pelethousia sp.]
MNIWMSNEETDGNMESKQFLDQQERFGVIECILFVSGEAVDFISLQRVLGVTELELHAILTKMEAQYKEQHRGIQLYRTADTVQLISNRCYAGYVEELLQPAQSKSFSQAMMETLSIVAYKQPVTRNDIEAIRGVRCDYSVSQLQKLGLIREVGRKDAVGKPILFGTTDAFLRQFGLHSLSELPSYETFSSEDSTEKPAFLSISPSGASA